MPDFAIGSVEIDGAAIPVVTAGDDVHDIRRILPEITVTADLFPAWDANLDRISAYIAAPSAPPLGSAGIAAAGHVLAPVQPVGPILAAGVNYREHIIQISVAHRLGREGAKPEELAADAAAEIDERVRVGDPYVWTGIPSAVSGAYDDIQLPDVGEDIDWELELGVVIGRRAHRVSAEDALSFVAGYVVVNDITSRTLVPRPDVQAVGTDWFRAKNQPTFFPTGPVLVPRRFVPDPSALRIQLSVNGDMRQDAVAADLAFDIPSLIAYTSSVSVLEPGYLLITGSPPGNGSHWGRFLHDGDVIESTITGLGVQRNTVRGPSGVLPPWQSSRTSKASTA